MENNIVCEKFRSAFELLSQKWTGLIIQVLLGGSKRFTDISEAIPDISAKILTERLKSLEAAEIIVRNVYAEVPVRIEYTLTKKGKSLEPIMKEVTKWAESWVE